MNTNWSKILLFSLISFALGFLICCMCCGRGCHRHGGCEGKEGCEMREGCEHGGMKGDCCKGGKEGCEKGEMQVGKCCMMDDHGDEQVHTVVMALEAKNFQGDTTITADGTTIKVSRHGDKMTVNVESRDSSKMEMEEETMTKKK